MEESEKLKRAASWLREADGLIVTAGAGMGVVGRGAVGGFAPGVAPGAGAPGLGGVAVWRFRSCISRGPGSPGFWGVEYHFH